MKLIRGSVLALSLMFISAAACADVVCPPTALSCEYNDQGLVIRANYSAVSFTTYEYWKGTDRLRLKMGYPRPSKFSTTEYYYYSGNMARLFEGTDGNSYKDYTDEPPFGGGIAGRVTGVSLLLSRHINLDYFDSSNIFRYSLWLLPNKSLFSLGVWLADGTQEGSYLFPDLGTSDFCSGVLWSCEKDSNHRVIKVTENIGFSFKSYFILIGYVGASQTIRELTYSTFSGELIYKAEYDALGNALVRETLPNGDMREWYAGGNQKSYFDASSGITTIHRDENPYGNHIGRPESETFADGTRKKYLAYWGDETPAIDDESTTAKLVERYDASNTLIETLTYGVDGKLKTKTLPDGSVYTYFEGSGNLKKFQNAAGDYLEFLDENFDGQGMGRIAKLVLISGAEYRMDEYWGGTGVYKALSFYQNGQFVRTNRFYTSGALESTLYADQSIHRFYEGSGRLKGLVDVQGNVIEFYDDTFGASGLGRYAKIVMTSGLEFRFLEYWGNTTSYKRLQLLQGGQEVWTQTFYASGALESYGDPVSGSLFTFFEASQNRKSTFVVSTGTLYEHRDENWQGTKAGRHSKIIEQDGSYKVFVSYWGDETPGTADDTGHVRLVDFYNNQGQRFVTYEYNVQGSPIAKTVYVGVVVTAGVAPSNGPDETIVSDEEISKQDMMAEMAQERKSLSREQITVGEFRPIDL